MKPESPPLPTGPELAAYRLVFAARVVGTVKTDSEERVAVAELQKAAIEYARYVFEKLIPPPL